MKSEAKKINNILYIMLDLEFQNISNTFKEYTFFSCNTFSVFMYGYLFWVDISIFSIWR